MIVLIGCVLPYIRPLAGPLGFIPLPASFFLFLVEVVVVYLLLVDVVKRRLLRDVAT